MEPYTIGFKSGRKVNLMLKDGNVFVQQIIAGIEKKPGAPVQFYVEPGLLICVSEIEFIARSSALKAE